MKRFVRWLLRRASYSISRIPDRHLYHVHDYADIRFILDGWPEVAILDVGANHGLTIDTFLRIFPDARVAGVEANPALCESLRARYAGDPRVSIHPFAAGEAEADAELTVNSNDGMSSLLPWKPGSEHAAGTVGAVPVRCRPLDLIADDAGLAEVAVLKLDVQGAELAALRGASRLLGEGRVKLILCEVWFSDRDYEGQPNFCEVYGHLAARGFSVYGLYNTTQHPYIPNRPINCCDALFVHDSMLPHLKPLARVEVGGRPTTLNDPV